MTYRELIYMILDELKVASDDSYYTEEHIAFLASKHRALLLKQRYSDPRKLMPLTNHQTLCLELETIEVMPDIPCVNADKYKVSTVAIPPLMRIAKPRLYAGSYFVGEITYVERDRMRYVGYSPYMPLSVIYGTIGDDMKLYLKSSKDITITHIRLSGVFSDDITASALECAAECDLLDRTYPLEDNLVPILINSVVKGLSPALYRPEDTTNNAADDLISKPEKNAK